MLSTHNTPITLSLEIRGTTAYAWVPSCWIRIESDSGSSLTSRTLKTFFSLTAQVSIVSSLSESSIPMLNLSRNESFLRGPVSMSCRISGSVFLSRESFSHIFHASSELAGPTPTAPFIVPFFSSTRKRIALLKPRPSLIVTAVNIILSSLSISRVPLIAELIKNSLDSS